jgi:hypothetical protein
MSISSSWQASPVVCYPHNVRPRQVTDIELGRHQDPSKRSPSHPQSVYPLHSSVLISRSRRRYPPFSSPLRKDTPFVPPHPRSPPDLLTSSQTPPGLTMSTQTQTQAMQAQTQTQLPSPTASSRKRSHSPDVWSRRTHAPPPATNGATQSQITRLTRELWDVRRQITAGVAREATIMSELRALDSQNANKHGSRAETEDSGAWILLFLLPVVWTLG